MPLYLNNERAHKSISAPERQRRGRFLCLFQTVLAGLILFLAGESCFASESRNFDAQVDFLNQNLAVKIDLKEKGTLEITGSIEENKYNLAVSLRHIKLGKSDISSDFYAAGIISRTKEGKLKSLKGRAWTQASLLNFKPLKEFSADYEIADSTLVINSLSWADIKCQGLVNSRNNRLNGIFLDPDIELDLEVRDMDLRDFAGLLGISPADVELAGLVSGNIRLNGPKDALKIGASLGADSGAVSRIRFNSAKIDLEGIWPVMRFTSGQINDTAGIVYDLKGQFSLTELSNFHSAEHKVMISSASNVLRLQEWIIKQGSDPEGRSVVEAEYPLKNNQSLKMRIKSQEEILGWEKSVKF